MIMLGDNCGIVFNLSKSCTKRGTSIQRQNSVGQDQSYAHIIG